MSAGFIPKEDILQLLMGMGYSRNASTRALYYTGNSSGDLAAAWILDNEDQDIDSPFVVGEEGDSSSDEEAGMEEFLAEGDFYKMVFVINSALDMGVGKVAAQTAHAALGVFKVLLDDPQKFGAQMHAWEQYGETKIVCKGTNAAQLVELASKAASLGLAHYIVEDAGRTQVAAGSMTVLGVMGKNDVVDQVTGHLSLL